MIYTVEVRDKNNKPYKDKNGKKVVNAFKNTIEDIDKSLMKKTLENICNNYEAVCKEGSIINIEVKKYDNISYTYMTLYSYYGLDKKFVEHK